MKSHFLINAILQKQQDVQKLYVELNEEIKRDLQEIECFHLPFILDITKITSELSNKQYFIYGTNEKVHLDFYIRFKTKFEKTDALKNKIQEHNEKFHYSTKYFEPIASTSYYWRDNCARSFSIIHDEYNRDSIFEYPEFNIKCSKEDFVLLKGNIIPLVFKTDNSLRVMRQSSHSNITHESNFNEWKKSLSYK